MRSRPPLATGLLSGAIIGGALVAILLLMVQAMRRQPIGMDLFLIALLLLITLPLVVIWLGSMVELLTLRYEVNRNAVLLATAFRQIVIPHAEVRALRPATAAEAEAPFRGASWPGFLRGVVQHPDLGKLEILATEPIGRLLILETPAVNYGLSPRNPAQFLQAYARCRELGPLVSARHATLARTLASWPIWRDRAYWVATGLALLGNLALIAYAMVRYEHLPAIIPMHWDALGQIDRLAPKAWALTLPAIGALTLVLNSLLGIALSFRERYAARLLAWAGVAIQASLWWAALGILAP